VTVAVRTDAAVLARAVTVIVPPKEPETGDTVSQPSLLLTDQPVFDDIVNDLASPAATKLREVVDTVRVAAAASACCVTSMVRVTPPPVMVMVAMRSALDVNTSATTVTVPFIEPEAGETVNHVALLLTVQLMFEVMANC
jgi:hypothetical protein